MRQQAHDAMPAEQVRAQKRLNERQRQALAEVQQRGHITNGDLQQAYPEVTAETLRLNLVDLVQRAQIGMRFRRLSVIPKISSRNSARRNSTNWMNKGPNA